MAIRSRVCLAALGLYFRPTSFEVIYFCLGRARGDLTLFKSGFASFVCFLFVGGGDSLPVCGRRRAPRRHRPLVVGQVSEGQRQAQEEGALEEEASSQDLERTLLPERRRLCLDTW